MNSRERDRWRLASRMYLALKAICTAWEKDGDVGAPLLAEGHDAVVATEQWAENPFRAGDLVLAEMIGVVYHGLVLVAEKPGVATVFLANGLTVDLPWHEIERVPMHFQSTCTANFAEIMKPYQWGHEHGDEPESEETTLRLQRWAQDFPLRPAPLTEAEQQQAIEARAKWILQHPLHNAISDWHENERQYFNAVGRLIANSPYSKRSGHV